MVSIPVKTRSGAVTPMTIEQKLAKSRMMARDLFPYWAPVINSLVLVEEPSVKRKGVNYKLICAYNRDFVESISLVELMWVWIHEACHILNKHCERWAAVIGMKDQEMKDVFDSVEQSPKLMALARIWNIAGDAASNQKLESLIGEINKHNQSLRGRVNHNLPSGYVSPATIEMEYGNSTEFYYKGLLDKQEKEEKGSDENEGNSGSEGKPCGNNSGDSDKKESDGDSSDTNSSIGESDKQGDSEENSDDQCGTEGEAEQAYDPGKGVSGSSAGGMRQPWEKNIPEDIGRSDNQVDLIVENTAREVERYASQGIGFVPDSIKQWASDFLDPPVGDWTIEFSSALSNTSAMRRGSDLYKFGKVSRTQLKMGGIKSGKPIYPAMVASKPTVAIVGDTSGSMGKKELATIIGTVKGIVEATEVDILFCSCDARAGEIQKIENWDEVPDLLYGGGGTDFSPAFKALAEEYPQPETVVYITDGGGAAPDEEPDWCEVIWVLAGRYRQVPYKEGYRDRIDWGEYVYPEID